MKSYEEMTRSVIARAEQERQNRKRRRSVAVKTAVGLCCFSLVVLGAIGFLLPETQTPGDTLNREPRTKLVLVSAAAEVKPAEILKDMVTHCRSQICVRDVRDLSLKEREKAWADAKADGKNEWEYSARDNWNMHFGSDTAIISVLSDGLLRLVVEDIRDVKNAEVTATQMGAANVGAADYYEGDDSLVIYWQPSDTAVAQLEKDPDMKLSKLGFTLTVTVEFKDETKETAVIDMTVDDEGYVYATLKGITVTG